MSLAVEIETLAPEDLDDLRRAVALLSGRSFAARAAYSLGQRATALSGAIPLSVREAALRASETALKAALRAAIRSVKRAPTATAKIGRDRALVALTGAVGGGMGFLGSAVELPISTTLMLRSIAAIAREQGEDLSAPESALACLEVLALDGAALGGATIDLGYFAVRAALARSVREAARYLAGRGAADELAPALARLVAEIASRFGVVVSEKFIAQSIPVVGAAFGAGVNLIFLEHYQRLALGHFTIRRLERRYGGEVVRREAERVRFASRSGSRTAFH